MWPTREKTSGCSAVSLQAKMFSYPTQALNVVTVPSNHFRLVALTQVVIKLFLL